MRDDFPALERPIKATSLRLFRGISAKVSAETVKRPFSWPLALFALLNRPLRFECSSEHIIQMLNQIDAYLPAHVLWQVI